jgi:hypothetical protein
VHRRVEPDRDQCDHHQGDQGESQREDLREIRAGAPRRSTIIGTVITGGDSCGCTSSAQRFRPKNVMSISRVM